MFDIRKSVIGLFLIEKLLSDASSKDALNVKNAESVYVLVKTETTLKSFSSSNIVHGKK